MLFPIEPKCTDAKSESGVVDAPNIFQFIAPSEDITNNKQMIAIITVPPISARGITFSGFFVSSARNVAVSHPKNVSAIKKIVMNNVEIGNTNIGSKFPGLNFNKFGTINASNVPIVINANVTNITALVFIPLYAIKLKINMNNKQIDNLTIVAGIGNKYCIAPTISMAMVIFPARIVTHPIMNEGNLPNACLQNS